MGRALNQLLVQIQKLVFLPFKVCTSMWTLVVVSKKLTIFMDQKNRLNFTADFNLETFTAGVFDISGSAENMGHDVC